MKKPPLTLTRRPLFESDPQKGRTLKPVRAKPKMTVVQVEQLLADQIIVGFRLNADLVKQIDAYATVFGMSRSAAIRKILQEHLK